MCACLNLDVVLLSIGLHALQPDAAARKRKREGCAARHQPQALYTFNGYQMNELCL